MSVRRARPRALLFLILAVIFLISCAPAFNRGDKSQEEFDRDSTQCLEENTTKTAARYGPSRYTNWNNYVQCMSSKGYSNR